MRKGRDGGEKNGGKKEEEKTDENSGNYVVCQQSTTRKTTAGTPHTCAKNSTDPCVNRFQNMCLLNCTRLTDDIQNAKICQKVYALSNFKRVYLIHFFSDVQNSKPYSLMFRIRFRNVKKGVRNCKATQSNQISEL